MRPPIFILFFMLGCSTPKPAVEPPPPAPVQCAVNQFVSCTSGEDCTRTRGKHLHEHACHDHAASACDALACKHGCNIHPGPIGEASDVFCAPSELGSSHMKKCAGFSGWGCPENMTCELDPRHAVDDEMGTCVPKSGAAN